MDSFEDELRSFKGIYQYRAKNKFVFEDAQNRSD